MRRVFILVNIFVALSLSLYSQKTASVWYFGKGIGVNFNANPPAALYNGKPSLEGCASIADGDGNLLFYTNGTSLFSKDHSQMLNSQGLAGNLSSTDNVVIAPMPGSTTQYYVFTVTDANEVPLGLSYSVVDLSLNNGLGEVIEKNTHVRSGTMEKIAAVRHCNKKDIWICVKGWEDDAYYAYLLTSTGLSATPVVSNMGFDISGNILNSLGSLRFSPDGSKLAAVHSFENDVVQLMRFNNQTGVLSSPVIFKVNDLPLGIGYPGAYGVAFSFDGRLLYVSSRTSAAESSMLFQFDISSHVDATILASKYLVHRNDNWRAGGLQQAPNGKIYYSQWNASALSVINSPNVPGAGCDYQQGVIDFSNGPQANPLELGLPNFIASDIDSVHSVYNFEWRNIGGCNSRTFKFFPNNITDADSIKWNFGDGGVASGLSPEHSFSTTGTFTVTMTYYKLNCGTNVYISANEITINELNNLYSLPADISFCQGNEVVIKPNTVQNLDSLVWNTGEKTDSIIVTNPGIYWVDFYRESCVFRDSITVFEQSAGFFDLGEDKQVCSNQPATFSVNISGSATYLWSTGSTASSITVGSPGLYWVEVQLGGGCVSRDSVRTTAGDCKSFLPSAFSPNGDGLNETFGVLGGISSDIFKLQVFNRYGDVVFTTKNPSEKWDGRVKGQQAPIGNYVWVMEYRNNAGFIQTDKGSVLLLH